MVCVLLQFLAFDTSATNTKNTGLEWRKYIEQFESLLVTCNFTSNLKKSFLLHYMNEEMHYIFESLLTSILETKSEHKVAKGKLYVFTLKINPAFTACPHTHTN